MSTSRLLCPRALSRLGSSLAARRSSAAFYSTASGTSEAALNPESTASGTTTHPSSSGSSDESRQPSSRRAPDDPAIAIFNEIVGKDAQSNPSSIEPTQLITHSRPKKLQPRNSRHSKLAKSKPGYKTALDFPSPAMGELDLARRLNDLNRGSISFEERFRIFMKDLWPHIEHLIMVAPSRTALPKSIYIQANAALGIIVDGLANDNLLQSKAALEICEVYDRLSKPDLRIRSGLIMKLCLSAWEDKGAPSDANIFQIITMWKKVSQMKRPSQRGQRTQFALPTEEHILSMLEAAKHKHPGNNLEYNWELTTLALSAIFNQFPSSHARYGISGLLATLATIADPNVNPKALRSAAPLLELSRLVLSQAPIDMGYIDEMFNEDDTRFNRSKLSELRETVKDRWEQVMELLTDEKAAWRKGLLESATKKQSSTGSLDHFHKALARAHGTNNSGVIISLWQKLRATMTRSSSLASEMRDNPEFLDKWYFVWCASKRNDKLAEMKDVMDLVGLQPTVRTYTAMMHGWKLARDEARISAMWDSLRSSRIELDVHAWTERISGLIELGKAQQGIETLAEMLSLWKTAVASGNTAKAVQPTIIAINAAFRPLMRIDKKAAADVLAWAEREGIKPDVRTYNILMAEAGVNGEGVHSLLQAMGKQGIEPDGATFTMVLESALGDLHGANTELQVEAVNKIMADIKSAGVRPNLETYGKMLHAVASLPNGADAAVEAVLQQMRTTGHKQLSPHMGLILMERGMNRGQRNPDFIKQLLKRHGFTSVKTGDQRLWERVVQNYSVLGDTTSAMEIYEEMKRASGPLTRQATLRELLLALVENGEVQAARTVVADAVRNIKAIEALPERRWRHHFWNQAYQLGLFEWDKAPADLRRAVDRARHEGETEAL